jgi:hypothetical protein
MPTADIGRFSRQENMRQFQFDSSLFISSLGSHRLLAPVLISWIFMATTPAFLEAGKIPYTKEQLQQLSSVIVTGTVVAIEHRLIAESNNSQSRRWKTTVQPDKVEKGTVPPGDLFFSFLTNEEGPVWCGPAQDPTPEIGDRVRAHAETGVMFEGQSVYPMLAPNGWEIIDSSGRTGVAATSRDDENLTLLDVVRAITTGERQRLLEYASEYNVPLSMPMKLLLSPFGLPVLIMTPVIVIGLIVLIWKRRRRSRSDPSPQ